MPPSETSFSGSAGAMLSAGLSHSFNQPSHGLTGLKIRQSMLQNLASVSADLVYHLAYLLRALLPQPIAPEDSKKKSLQTRCLV